MIRSDIGYLMLFPFQQLQSEYRDRASSGTFMADITIPGKGIFKPKMTFGGSYVMTSGSRPSRYYQPQGKLVIPITGRPAGWCDHIARMWPVDAVVGENGTKSIPSGDRRRRLMNWRTTITRAL